MEVNRTLRLTNINVVLSDDNGDSSGSITPVEEDPGLTILITNRFQTTFRKLII